MTWDGTVLTRAEYEEEARQTTHDMFLLMTVVVAVVVVGTMLYTFQPTCNNASCGCSQNSNTSGTSATTTAATGGMMA
jgi:hypothetical protein